MKHLDLFSGIGGFAIAAQWAGFETVAFCESDARCRTFLERTWNLPVHDDIRTLDGRRYTGISLLTGGPPCQPASRAGKQGGEKDDRWLWGEALRVLDEAKPDCVVFENPPGILDVGIDGILSEMGGLGYETQVFDIPACAVDSPQLRHRIWIVGFLGDAMRLSRQRDAGRVSGTEAEISREGQSDGRIANVPCDADESLLADTRCERNGKDEPGRGPGERTADRRDCAGIVADSSEPGRERRDAERAPNGCRSERAESERADTESQRRRETEWRSSWDDGHNAVATEGAWSNSVWVPCADNKLRRAPDDSFSLVNGVFAEVSGIVGSRPHRSILGALGNSIVPQVAYPILKALKQILDEK